MMNVIKGYKGIMDLDLTNIHPTHHKSLIKQHKKDIINYILMVIYILCFVIYNR